MSVATSSGTLLGSLEYSRSEQGHRDKAAGVPVDHLEPDDDGPGILITAG
jgi:hypothetical protein